MKIEFTRVRRSDDDYPFVQEVLESIQDVAKDFTLNNPEVEVSRYPDELSFGFHFSIQTKDQTKGSASIFAICTKMESSTIIYNVDDSDTNTDYTNIKLVKNKIKSAIKKRLEMGI